MVKWARPAFLPMLVRAEIVQRAEVVLEVLVTSRSLLPSFNLARNTRSRGVADPPEEDTAAGDSGGLPVELILPLVPKLHMGPKEGTVARSATATN
jgi:hypothetical protein